MPSVYIPEKIGKRRLDVKRLLEDEHETISSIARILNCAPKTVKRDLIAMSIPTFSEVTEEHTTELVAGTIIEGNGGMGVQWVQGRVRSTGHRIQRWKLRRALKHIGGGGGVKYRKKKRFRWYDTKLPLETVAIDQHEELSRFKIFSFAAIDAFSRVPLHHKVVTNLTGPTHTEFWTDTIEQTGVFPTTVACDMTHCWQGVSVQSAYVFGHNDPWWYDLDGTQVSNINTRFG